MRRFLLVLVLALGLSAHSAQACDGPIRDIIRRLLPPLPPLLPPFAAPSVQYAPAPPVIVYTQPAQTAAPVRIFGPVRECLGGMCPAGAR